MSDKFEPTYWVNPKEKIQSGKIIVLNGTSSAGKGSICKILQETLEEPFFHFELDRFLHMFPLEKHDLGLHILKVLKSFYDSAKNFALQGNNILIDTVFQDGPYDRGYVLDILEGMNVTYIGVKCDLDELKRRCEQRGDRNSNLAPYQFPRVHHGANYCFEVDTTNQSPEKCAKLIKDFLDKN